MVNGVMQIGIGVTNAEEAFEWYKKAFELSVRMFDDEAEAALMTRYTGGEVFKRRAILGLSKAGGGGFEIWQFTNRKSSPQPKFQIGTPGINAIILKVSDLGKAKAHFKQLDIETFDDPDQNGFYVKDLNGNLFKLIERPDSTWSQDWTVGGALGAVLGVRDLTKAKDFYKSVFGMKEVGEAKTLPHVGESFPHELQGLSSAKRITLTYQSQDPKGFGPVYPDIVIELVENPNVSQEHLFKDRFWGDLGYIHFCYDVEDMPSFKKHCERQKAPFTVDSKDTFNMEDSGGHFAYLEDPDGTLIELIQVHKVPIIKKLGVFLDLRKSKSKKVPRWMIKTLLRRQEKIKR